MNAHEIVMRSPFRYHTAATFIEADVAAVMQAAVRKEGHVPALPQQNAKVEEHEASRARVAVLIMKMIEEQGHVSYLQIANRILGVSMYVLKMALADLKEEKKIAFIQTRSNQSNVYCLPKDALKVVKLYPAAKIVQKFK